LIKEGYASDVAEKIMEVEPVLHVAKTNPIKNPPFARRAKTIERIESFNRYGLISAKIIKHALKCNPTMAEYYGSMSGETNI
jgi:hypothetical protein